MRVAALDLGSNTFLLLIAEVQRGQVEKVLVDEMEVTRLGQGVHKNGKFCQEALSRADHCLSHYAEIIQEYAVDKVLAVATSAARDAQNKEEFLALGRKWSIPISIISGNEEAVLTYKGSALDLSCPPEFAVIDVGGGSTEVLGQDSRGQVCGCSLDVGSVRLTEMFVQNDPITEREILDMDAYIYECILAKKRQIPQSSSLVAVAGTPVTLGAISRGISPSADELHGCVLTLKQIINLRERLSRQTLDQRKQQMDPGRADVIVAGTSILKGLIEALGGNRVFVSTKGVRYGLVLQ